MWLYNFQTGWSFCAKPSSTGSTANMSNGKVSFDGVLKRAEMTKTSIRKGQWQILSAMCDDERFCLCEQVWSLHALALIADSGGPMFRADVEPTLSLVLQLLLTVPPATVDVHQCLGKCLSALITSIGPELQSEYVSVWVNFHYFCRTRTTE